MQGLQVWFPVGELKPHMPPDQKNPKHKTEVQHCNQFNKDFESGPH